MLEIYTNRQQTSVPLGKLRHTAPRNKGKRERLGKGMRHNITCSGDVILVLLKAVPIQYVRYIRPKTWRQRCFHDIQLQGIKGKERDWGGKET